MEAMNASLAAAVFEEIANTLRRDGASRSEVMGRPMLTLDGRMFACLDGATLAVRLGRWTAEYEGALDVPGASVFSPGLSGRTFNDWVSLPLDAAPSWRRFARAALSHVTALPANR
jgi:hypothetical protein